jgi:hypothetical protein
VRKEPVPEISAKNRGKLEKRAERWVTESCRMGRPSTQARTDVAQSCMLTATNRVSG